MIDTLVAAGHPVLTCCRFLGASKPGYYRYRNRAASSTQLRRQWLTGLIREVHLASRGTYGYRRVHAEVTMAMDVTVSSRLVSTLMHDAGVYGLPGPASVKRLRGVVTSGDLVNRKFHRVRPNELWVTDITEHAFAGWVYAAFVTDVYSRRVVGWQLSKSLRTDLALDALEMGIWTRQRAGHDVTGLTHHSDKGVQYVAIRYTQRPAEASAVASVGSTGDSYDNALAEAFNSLFKAELVRNKGPWKSIDDLEIAVAEYVDWFNHRRLHGEIGLIPPADLEETYYRQNTAAANVEASVASLH